MALTVVRCGTCYEIGPKDLISCKQSQASRDSVIAVHAIITEGATGGICPLEAGQDMHSFTRSDCLHGVLQMTL